jgi:tetratricopeptide (TPR) repeat protein
MRAVLRNVGALHLCFVLLVCGCDALYSYDTQIKKASHDIETAANDTQRAAAYAERGRGYSDKARLSLLRTLISHDEYRRLFSLSMKDHGQSIALDPGNAEMYFKRGLSHYDRAALANEAGADHGFWFDKARADFMNAIVRDPRHSMAYDYLGLVNEQTDRIEQAIVDYTHEMELNPKLGRSRLADVYCNRGRFFLEKKQYAAAVSDFEKSIEFGLTADGCSCEPYNPLAYIYIDVMRSYDKGWELVHRTQGIGNPIAPEYIERLKKIPARNDKRDVGP